MAVQADRIFKALIKHQGRQIEKDKCRIEIDLSVLLEMFSLEDYIKELEEKITKQELLIVNMQQILAKKGIMVWDSKQQNMCYKQKHTK